MSGVILHDRSPAYLAVLAAESVEILDRCGQAASRFAKAICPVDTGRLKNSIAYRVDAAGDRMVLGTNVEYADEVELGTGIYYAGDSRVAWLWQDERGRWRVTHGQKPQPYLRPALADHGDEYQAIIRRVLED